MFRKTVFEEPNAKALEEAAATLLILVRDEGGKLTE
jgi:hypothetical protein